MTSLPGGPADKAGNKYEHWWTARVVAELLTGAASQLQLEPAGAAGEGIEFLVVRAGEAWGEQVKLRSGTWTLQRLRKEGVLQNALAQVQAGKRFRLIVSTDAPRIDTLTRRSRHSDDLAKFETSLSSADHADFLGLADSWGIEPDQAFVVLSSIYVEPHPVENLRQLVSAEFRLLFADDPEIVLGEIRNLCDDHMHKTLTAPHVWEHLESKGFKRRHLAGDTSTINKLRKTVERHARHVEDNKPGIGLVPSIYLDQLRSCLMNPDGKQLAVVDGSAGYGKSTIVSAVAAELQASGWFVAAANMSVVQHSAATSTKIGDQLGLGDNSPGVVLACVADGAPGLLVIDQLDAVGTYSGRITEVYEAIAEVLAELTSTPNIKILLVIRTVDLESDHRFARFRDAKLADRVTVGKLTAHDVNAKLGESGVPLPTSDVTAELLRTPLHLSIFLRLSQSAQRDDYPSLQRLYDRYTEEVRQSVESGVGHLNWVGITSALVDHMNTNERLSAPVTVLDSFGREELHALESADVLSVDDNGAVSFFHESFFDYLFARTFVATGKRLLDFVTESGQNLFRRAQTRQVLEHLAATDRGKFRDTVRDVLSSLEVRSHLKEVVVDVLAQIDATTDDWLAIDDVAWSDSKVAWRLLVLLNQPSWFVAADSLGKWPEWLSDPVRVDKAFHQLRFIAREQPRRVVELVRPFMGTNENWKLRLKSMVEWSLKAESTDFAIELLERGDLDDARGPIAVNSDFWSIVFGLAQDDPSAAAELIGAYLNRGLVRAQAEGSDDPFDSGQLPDGSASDEIISQVAAKAPKVYLASVLTFVEVVAQANRQHVEHRLPVGRRWAYRSHDTAYSVGDKVFDGTAQALIALADSDPALCDEYIRRLGAVESEELHFLACIGLTKRGSADTAIAWLIGDPRNLELGYMDNASWASRSLIERWSGECSDSVFGRLEALILSYSPEWETRYPGAARLRLLTALDTSRLSASGNRALVELQRRFPGIEPSDPPRRLVASFVGSPISEAAGQKMSDGDWMGALRKYTSDETDWHGDRPVGGARELSLMLGRQAEQAPERFAKLALGFGPDVHSSAMDSVIRAVGTKIDPGLLAELCEHAQATFGSDVGRAICATAVQAKPATERMAKVIAKYVSDPDPDQELARTNAGSGANYYGGDFDMAGLNSVRGQVAYATAVELFESADHLDVLRPVVEALAVDPIMAVRAYAAEALLALMNYEAELAYDLGEALLDADIELYNTRGVERLMSYLLVRQPQRFGPLLARGLAGPHAVAVRAGHLWALLSYRESLPDGVPSESSGLSVEARRGAAESFAHNLAEAAEQLVALFDDPDEEVRKQAASSMRYLESQDSETTSNLVQNFLHSTAFDDHFDELIRELGSVQSVDAELALQVCERAISVAGAEVGDIRTARSMLGQPVMVSLLRVYRQGDAGQRERCLDVIDRLSELNAYGLAEALGNER